MIKRNRTILRAYSGSLVFFVLSVAGCRVNPARSRTPLPSVPVLEATEACVRSMKPEFAYILDGRKISTLSVDSCTGLFTHTDSASVPTGNTDTDGSSEALIADPKGRFVYVANPGMDESSQSTVSMYAINRTTGLLTPTSPATVPTGWYPQEIVVDPLGRFVYTANTYGRSLSMFTIDQVTGVLTPTKPASVTTVIPGHLKSAVLSFAIDPAGRFLYVPTTFTSGAATFGAAISVFAIDQLTGMLKADTAPIYLPAEVYLFDAKVTPDGRFLYVVNNNSSGSSAEGVWKYSIDSSTGRLSPIEVSSSISAAVGSGSTAITVDPTSRFAYVVNRAGNSISMFAINPSTGALKPNISPKAPLGVVSEIPAAVPFRITFGASGRFVYVTNQEGAIAIYKVDEDGTLVNAGKSGPAAGALSTAIVSPK